MYTEIAKNFKKIASNLLQLQALISSVQNKEQNEFMISVLLKIVQKYILNMFYKNEKSRKMLKIFVRTKL